MQLIKKIFYTILILFGICVMVVLFMFAIMMVFHTSIFGYTYANVTKVDGETYAAIERNDIDSIEIETNAANIVIDYTGDAGANNFSIMMKEDFQGIIKDNVKRYSYEKEPTPENIENKVLKITTVEPEGLIFQNSTTIYIYLPQGKVLDNISIKTKSENISFGTDDFEVKNLNVISTKKSLSPGVSLNSNLKITDSLSLETYAGRINVGAEIGDGVNDVEVDIKTHIGTILFNKSIKGNVKISGDNPNIEFGTITQGFINNVKKNGDYNTESLKKVDITGDLTIDGVENGGNIKISGTVGGFVYMKSPRMSLWANNINGGIVSETGSDEIIIFGSLGQNDPSQVSELHVGSDLLIVNPYMSLEIYAQKNGVEIRNAHNNVYVENDNWDTIVEFADNAEGKTLTVRQAHGNIIAKNIRGTADLVATNGKVTAEFTKVVGDNVVESKYEASVKVHDGLTYKLIAKGKSTLKIDLGAQQYNSWSGAQTVGAYKQLEINVPINSSSSTNTLSIFSEEKGLDIELV